MPIGNTHGLASALAMLAAGAVVSASGVAQAQESFPDRPIRLVIPFAPGGQTDIMGRRYAAKAATPLGQHIIVDNRSGAGGTIGSNEVARARPDGYTLLMGTSSTHAINPTAMPNIPYDPIRDFAPISVLGTVSMSIVVHPSVPARNLREFVAQVKSRPGQYAYASTGVGGINHLGGELLKLQAGKLDMVHVPYKSSGLSLQDLLGGHVPVVIATLSSAMQYHREGRLRILAVASQTRSRAAPDIPTAVEAGVPGMIAYTFNVLLAPAGTARPVIDRLHRVTATVMGDEALVKDLIALGVEPITDSTPEKAAAFIKTELERWRPVIRMTGTSAGG